MEVYTTAWVLLLFCNKFILLDGFQWSYYQQANHVMNVVLGSDVSLPCEYVLTPQEQQEANIFHLLTWTREQPFNSEHWAGLAVKSTLTGSKVIYDDPQHIFITNNTLQVTNVSVEDHTRYQCAFQSSFFSSPSTIELNVQYRPTETQLSSSVEPVEEGKPLLITCTARANPSAARAMVSPNTPRTTLVCTHWKKNVPRYPTGKKVDAAFETTLGNHAYVYDTCQASLQESHATRAKILHQVQRPWGEIHI